MAHALLLIPLVLCGAHFRDSLGGAKGFPGRAALNPDVFRLLAAAPAANEECTGSFATGAISPATISITTTRASTRYCTKTDGTMVLLTANQPAIEGGGLLTEPSQVYRSMLSEAFDTWSCTDATVEANTHAAPDGTMTADTITTTAPGGYCERSMIEAIGAFSGGGAVHVRTVSGTGTAACSFIHEPEGTETKYTTKAITTTWGVRKATADGRMTCVDSAGDTFDGASTLRFRVYPAGNGPGMGSAVFWGAQVTTNDHAAMPSYFPTTTANATRAADVHSFTKPARWPTGTGAFVAKFYSAINSGSSGTTFMDTRQNTGTVNGWTISLSTGSKQSFVTTIANSASTRLTPLIGLLFLPGTQKTHRFEFGADLATYLDGVAQTDLTGTYTQPTVIGGTVYLGTTYLSGNFTRGWLSGVCVSMSAAGCL